MTTKTQTLFAVTYGEFRETAYVWADEPDEATRYVRRTKGAVYHTIEVTDPASIPSERTESASPPVDFDRAWLNDKSDPYAEAHGLEG